MYPQNQLTNIYSGKDLESRLNLNGQRQNSYGVWVKKVYERSTSTLST